MTKLKKKMCKYAKDGLKNNRKEILCDISDAGYVCKKCLRVASEKSLLCDPLKIKC